MHQSLTHPAGRRTPPKAGGQLAIRHPNALCFCLDHHRHLLVRTEQRAANSDSLQGSLLLWALLPPQLHLRPGALSLRRNAAPMRQSQHALIAGPCQASNRHILVKRCAVSPARPVPSRRRLEKPLGLGIYAISSRRTALASFGSQRKKDRPAGVRGSSRLRPRREPRLFALQRQAALDIRILSNSQALTGCHASSAQR